MSRIGFNLYKISKESSVYKAYYRLIFLLSGSSLKSENYINSYEGIRNFDYIVCANIWQILQTWVHTIGSNTKIIFWIQGVVAEESYLKNKSKMRFYILKMIEFFCLYLSDAYIFVSPYMKDVYSSKNIVRGKPNLVIPCVSDLDYKHVGKKPLSFCYLGGMSEWQNFPTIVKMMSEINDKYPQSSFKIATNETILASSVIDNCASDNLKNKIKLCSLFSKKDIEEFLSECEFGFLIRDDIIVNQVSSPIKMAEYLSCGVNVITTKAIRSYSPLLGQAGIIIESIADINIINFKANTEAALKLYNEMFSQDSVQQEVNLFVNQLRV